MHKKIISLFLLGSFLVGCNNNIDTSVVPSDPTFWDVDQDNLRKGTKSIDFYNLNDTHGAIEGTSEEPGIARVATYLKNKKSEDPQGFVLTSSGDMWQGSADSNITRGHLMTEWMNYMEFSAMALGNHEFDWTIDAIKENQQLANFPFLACNIINTSNNEVVDWVKPYTTITRNGVHIGIIGAIGEGITSSILADNVKGLKFDNPDSYVEKWSKYLKDNGADVILYLYHETTSSISYDIGDHVDAIFGGHNHMNEKITIGRRGVPAVEGSCNGKYVSHINVRFNFSNRKVSWGSYGYDNYRLSSLSEDQGTKDIKQKYAPEINEIKNERVAYIPRSLSSTEGVPHTYNVYAYRYYNDVEESPLDIDVVVTNNGRYSISSGIVTYGDIYRALPFDNYLVLFHTTGYHLKQIATYASSHWYLPSVSSETISYNQVSQYFENNKTYNILTINYIAANESYSSWLQIDKAYLEDGALPRNIVKKYLSIDYPLS